MGRYMRKPKGNGEVAVMEVQQSTTIGVRTRAKTLALQRLDSSSYLELRSRRLEKPTSLIKPKESFFKENSNPSPKLKTSKSSSNLNTGDEIEDVEEVEVFFGENFLDFESRERNIRETTPRSLIRDSEVMRTSESTTRRANGTSRRIQDSMNRNIPTTNEMEEFFACTERLQQRIFIEKYNFDPVNECPLPGRYEWVKVE